MDPYYNSHYYDEYEDGYEGYPVAPVVINTCPTVCAPMMPPMMAPMGLPGQTTVVVQNPGMGMAAGVAYCGGLNAPRDVDGYIIDDSYYYYDNGFYGDYDYYDKDHYWKYFKTAAGEKFKYSRK